MLSLGLNILIKGRSCLVVLGKKVVQVSVQCVAPDEETVIQIKTPSAATTADGELKVISKWVLQQVLLKSISQYVFQSHCHDCHCDHYLICVIFWYCDACRSVSWLLWIVDCMYRIDVSHKPRLN